MKKLLYLFVFLAAFSSCVKEVPSAGDSGGTVDDFNLLVPDGMIYQSNVQNLMVWGFETGSISGAITTTGDWGNWTIDTQNETGTIRQAQANVWERWNVEYGDNEYLLRTIFSGNLKYWEMIDLNTGQSIDIIQADTTNYDFWAAFDGQNQILQLEPTYSTGKDRWSMYYSPDHFTKLNETQEMAIEFLAIFTVAIKDAGII